MKLTRSICLFILCATQLCCASQPDPVCELIEVEVEGVGAFIRHEIVTPDTTYVRYKCECILAGQNVELITYSDSGASIEDPRYQARVARVYSSLNESLAQHLSDVNPAVIRLAESYDAEYSSDWPTRIELDLVRIPFDMPVELSFNSHRDPIEPKLFHGLDLNLRFDDDWRLLRAWFDG